jgi:hypothetical protein
MIPVFIALILPALYWEQGTDTAPALKRAGVENLCVPAARVSAWKDAGFAASAPSDFTKVPPPKVRMEYSVASATRMPWVDANGWRYERGGGKTFFCDVPRGAAALAAAEAAAYDADVVLRIDPADLDAFGRMLTFLRRVERPPMPVMANIALVDDGSAVTGEVMNLMARRNLLFRVVKAPVPGYDLTVRIGSKEYPAAEARNPAAFAAKVRQQLTDDKRLLRIFGSNVVLGRLTGDSARVRVHLLNYRASRVEGLRIRVRGSYAKGTLAASGLEDSKLTDYAVIDGATEFTIPEMEVYAVVDLADAVP